MRGDRLEDILSVGQCYPRYANGLDVFVQLHFRDSFWQLDIGMRDIRQEEIREIQYGDLSIAFAEINHCLFVVFKFGKMEWCDTPYEPRLHNKTFDFRSFEPGTGAPLMVCIADTATGEIRAMRQIGLGSVVSNELHSACRRLQEEERPFDEQSYRWMVQKTYSRYKSSDMMLKTIKPGHVWILTKADNIET